MAQAVDLWKTVDRPNVITAIAEARAQGDLSENAEYDAARERQGFIEGRIIELEAKLPCHPEIGALAGGDHDAVDRTDAARAFGRIAFEHETTAGGMDRRRGEPANEYHGPTLDQRFEMPAEFTPRR